jgi:hypothetical protein
VIDAPLRALASRAIGSFVQVPLSTVPVLRVVFFGVTADSVGRQGVAPPLYSQI